MQNRKIAILDSGAGGLNISRRILEKEQQFDLLYIADKAGFPYGIHEQSKIIERIEKLVAQAIEKFTPELFIIACNTASTVALEHLRSRFDIPFIGVVPAIKPAVALSRTGYIAVLATPLTAKSQYLSALIEQFAKAEFIYTCGSKNLVALCESYIQTNSICQEQLEREVLPAIEPNTNIDTLVLACTHFPLIEKKIDVLFKKFGKSIKLIDSTDAIYRRLIDITNQTSTQSNRCINMTFINTEANELNHYGHYVYQTKRHASCPKLNIHYDYIL